MEMVGFLDSDFQHALVEGRQILDVVLIANEAINSKTNDNLRGIV